MAVAKFIAAAFLFYIAWFVFHDMYLMKKTNFVHDIIVFETNLSSEILNILPLKYDFSSIGSSIYADGKKTLRVGEECTGLVLFALFTGFIVCYPGPWKHKAWYIPLGIVIIFLVNILRIVLLVVNFKYYRSSFSFNHHVTFTYTVYAIIFLLWMVWVNKISKMKSST